MSLVTGRVRYGWVSRIIAIALRQPYRFLMVGAEALVRTAGRVIAVALVVIGFTAPVDAQGTSLTLGVDVVRFSERAAAWSSANSVRQAENEARAAELGREAAQAEADAEAAAAATRAAAIRAATTTIAPPTTSAAPVTTTAPPTTTSTAVTTTAPPAQGDGPTAEQWAALRHCESGGRYDAVSPTGRYRGAYQFSRATWDWVASFANPSLAGVDPAAAAPADQDAQAQALYDRQGAGPWPHCGKYLP